MSTYAILQALKSNRNPWNEASLVNYLSAGEISEEHENGLIWYRCDEHGICSAVSEIFKSLELEDSEQHLQSAHPWDFIIQVLV